MILKKVCVRCKTKHNLPLKPYTKTTKFGYYMCRDCSNNRTKKYFDKCKELVYEHYGSVCACCMESNSYFLTIDHKDNDGNNHIFPNGNKISGRHLYSVIIRNNYPINYQILCMNCNFGKSMNNGECPHKSV